MSGTTTKATKTPTYELTVAVNRARCDMVGATSSACRSRTAWTLTERAAIAATTSSSSNEPAVARPRTLTVR
jgi:hypothetical protein